jgi:hypothetical protein
VLARGRVDEVRIEALMREHGAHVEDYGGKRLVVADANSVHAGDRVRHVGGTFAASFIEPGLVALGSLPMIQSAIDLHRVGNNPQTGVQSATLNDELMKRIRSLDDGNAWVVGRFDSLRSQAHLPDNVASQIPAITWFSVKSRIDGGIRGIVSADTRDEEAANNLRAVVNGALALAKMQSASNPQLQAMMQSLELGGSGTTVSLSFAVPSQVFDLIAALAQGNHIAH